ncbi:MAG: DNA repair protein RecN [Anaerolineae bacterium]|nr:DNA repair protein RecN [Anaerolineae bacterium]
MLTELQIENVAIIQHLNLKFKSGLITFTGETGAGKSIILDAIMALMGGRVENTLIRSGAERAQVEATFSIPESNRQQIVSLLETEDLMDDPGYVTLGREIRREGRSVARLNGRSVNVNLLREVGSYLVDIHGQLEHLSLLNVRQHLGLLDRYADIEGLLAEYGETYQQMQSIRKDLTTLRQGEAEAERRLDLLNFQINEIEAAQLHAGEDVELRQERDRLANAENLASLSQQALSILDESSPEAPALSDMAGQIAQLLVSLARIDGSQSGLAEQASSLADSVTDLGRDLRDYLETIEFNPRRLGQLEDRLEMIRILCRKYGGNIESVLNFKLDALAKREMITHASERISELEQKEQSLLPQLTDQALALSQKRHAAAALLERGVEAELADLSMQGARFQVDFTFDEDGRGLTLEDGRRVAFDASGIDRIEFLIAPNPGEGFKPLVKIASGGETSRLMLALKNVLAQVDAIPTLIFDEIDQGIGGRVGTVVGEKLWQLGRRHQVLVVTHLPQLAAFGDQHFKVAKQVQDGRTQTGVEEMLAEKRVDELALMLGGVSDANRAAAREALALAETKAVP